MRLNNPVQGTIPDQILTGQVSSERHLGDKWTDLNMDQALSDIKELLLILLAVIMAFLFCLVLFFGRAMRQAGS